MIAYRYNISYMAPVAMQMPMHKPYRSGLYRDRSNCRRAKWMYAQRTGLPDRLFEIVKVRSRFRFIERR